MDGELQKKVFPLFHYALSPGGFLFLGASEGLAGAAGLFHDVDKKQRLFQRREAAVYTPAVFPLTEPIVFRGRQPNKPAQRVEQVPKKELGSIIERIVLEHAPPCVVINERADIVYSSGDTAPYLQQPTGTPTRNIIDQARKGLRLMLRTAIRKAMKSHQTVVQEDLAVKTPTGLDRINLIVRPLAELGEKSPLLAVLFLPAATELEPAAGSAARSEEAAVQQLETELRTVRGELQSAVEELEAANEDLKSSNEELLSMNEEMQSANEELQTSKEEMQSVNEELGTVNSELHRKIEQLDHANADLQNLIRSTEIATLFLDRDLRIKRFTPVATAIFRLLESDVGRPISDFAPRFADGDLIAEMKEVLQTLVSKEQQAYLPETRSWFIVRILASRTVENIVDGVVVTFVNITALKQAEDTVRQSEERVRQLTDTMPQIAWTSRPDGTMDYANERVRHYRGFQQRADGTWDWTAAVHPEDIERTMRAWERSVQTGEAYQMEHRLRLADGRWRWHLSRAVPIRDKQNRITKWSGTATDIHDLRTAQEELAAVKVSAERAKETAERANRAKDDFLAVLSHELRTPLAPVVATLESLQDDPRFDLDTRADLEMVHRNVELEARLIDDLLDVTRIERGKVELNRRPTDLGSILKQAVEVCMPDIEARKLEFGMDSRCGPYIVDGDAARLQQVFWNLLKNAVKFTPPGGCVGVRCCPAEEGYVCIEVGDSGEGIDPEVLPRLFSAFEQGGVRTTRQFGGLGLGLTISKTLVEMHGGTLSAGSEGKGKGATFTVTLPAIRGPLPAKSELPPPLAAGRQTPTHRRRILLVEDHADTARVMRRLLSAHGYEVQTAPDMATALHLAGDPQRDGFDLLISDLGLPDGNGLELMRTLRQQGLKMPGIALSGYGQEQDMAQSRQAGFVEHLVKPVCLPRLEEAIARILGEGAPAAPDQGKMDAEPIRSPM